ncbi:MAG: dipeptide/oligopeptide/nickel ABC transporter ATP-binding protein [Tissierellia bacterium]|nr:dipeptide/oligopeptide/nickel ABC transporter ATP-binding protein [Tissierellia bacterium]
MNILECRNMEMSFKKGIIFKTETVILKDINFDLKRGESLGIIGPSGSGKTTIAKCMLKLLPIISGQIIIDGCNINDYNRLALAKKLQLVTQNPEMSFDPDKKIIESLKEVFKIHGIYKKRLEADAKIESLLGEIGLKDLDLNKLPKFYSGGELQRLSILRALLVDPKIIIFDEVDSMLDTVIRLKLFKLLKDIRYKYDIAYIYITHDLNILPIMTDKFILIDKGRIIDRGYRID